MLQTDLLAVNRSLDQACRFCTRYQDGDQGSRIELAFEGQGNIVIDDINGVMQPVLGRFVEVLIYFDQIGRSQQFISDVIVSDSDSESHGRYFLGMAISGASVMVSTSMTPFISAIRQNPVGMRR